MGGWPVPEIADNSPISRHQAGYSLVELVIALVVLGIGLGGMVAVMSLGVTHRADALQDLRMLQIVENTLQEIQSRPFAEDGSSTACQVTREEAARAEFDDVDDYHGLDESPPRDAFGQPYPQAEGMRLQVAVSCRGQDLGLDRQAAKRIRVRVTDAQGETLMLTAYRSSGDED